MMMTKATTPVNLFVGVKVTVPLVSNSFVRKSREKKKSRKKINFSTRQKVQKWKIGRRTIIPRPKSTVHR
jgi:predicted oxidoreductase